MKILVISDSHGRNDDIKDVLRQVGHIDMLIHCGDVERGDEYVRSLVDCPVYMVAGNNDYDLDLPDTEFFKLGNHKVLLTHGHRYSVFRDVSKLRAFAEKNEADIVMFGHTHRPYLEIGEDMTILNPGSISYPRQQERKPTFLIMEMDEEGEIAYEHIIFRNKLSEVGI